MTLQSLIGAGMCAAALGVLLKQYRPEFAMILSVICSIGVLVWLLEQINPVLEKIQEMGIMTLPEDIAGKVLLKSLGICLITQIACDTCRDVGENAIASRLETAGKVTILLMSLPMFSQLLEQALHLIG